MVKKASDLGYEYEVIYKSKTKYGPLELMFIPHKDISNILKIKVGDKIGATTSIRFNDDLSSIINTLTYMIRAVRFIEHMKPGYTVADPVPDPNDKSILLEDTIPDTVGDNLFFLSIGRGDRRREIFKYINKKDLDKIMNINVNLTKENTSKLLFKAVLDDLLAQK